MKFLLYLLRWQLTIPILVLFIILLGSFNAIFAAIFANIIGACIFYWVDLWIFNYKEKK